MGFLWPTLNLTTVFNTTEGAAVNASRGAVANWTAAWLYLEYEDPTVSFSEAEYLQGSSEVCPASREAKGSILPQEVLSPSVADFVRIRLIAFYNGVEV